MTGEIAMKPRPFASGEAGLQRPPEAMRMAGTGGANLTGGAETNACDIARNRKRPRPADQKPPLCARPSHVACRRYSPDGFVAARAHKRPTPACQTAMPGRHLPAGLPGSDTLMQPTPCRASCSLDGNPHCVHRHLSGVEASPCREPAAGTALAAADIALAVTDPIALPHELPAPK